MAKKDSALVADAESTEINLIVLKRKKSEEFMKIAIPVLQDTKDSEVCMSFGRTSFFMFYNTVSQEYSFFDNSAINTQGGAGIKASQMLIDNNIDTLITQRLGTNAADVLNAADVKIYKSVNIYAKDDIAAFINNKLSILSEIHPGFHKHE